MEDVSVTKEEFYSDDGPEDGPGPVGVRTETPETM